MAVPSAWSTFSAFPPLPKKEFPVRAQATFACGLPSLLSSSTGPSTQLVLVKCLQEGKNNDLLFLALLESTAANLGKSLCLSGTLVSYLYNGELDDMV